MYLFVRFTGIVILIFGLLLMLVGFGGTVYGLIEQNTMLQLINTFFLAQSGVVLQDARLYIALLGLFLFVAGMVASALGQLMLVFIDIAVNAQETNVLLRALRDNSRADGRL